MIIHFICILYIKPSVYFVTMALLRRSLSLIGWVDRLHKISHCSLLKMPRASLLHTMESSNNGVRSPIIPSFVHQQQIIPSTPLFSILNTVQYPQIMPSPSRGRNAVLDLPPLPKIPNLEMPTSKAHLNNVHIMPEKAKMEDPNSFLIIKKHAVRMIVIRRQKMKKHQRRKAYKRNRIVYSRIRQARKLLKERNLQLKLLAQLNEGRNFNPEKYAFDLLNAAYEKVELPPKHKKKQPWEF